MEKIKLEEEIKQINEYAAAHSVPVMMEDGLEWMFEILDEKKPQTFLEIGTAIARTSIALANRYKDLKITTIEKKPEMAAQARKNIEESGQQDRITFIEGDARDVSLPAQEKFDVIFIDAAKGQYHRFFAKYAPLLKDNGIIISDNMNFHGMVQNPALTSNRHTRALIKKIQAYREFLAGLPDYETVILDRGDGVALTRRKR